VTWHSFPEFGFDHAFLAVQPHDSPDELVLSFIPDHFSPDKLTCFRDGICVRELD
jgi:hypothetical protein